MQLENFSGNQRGFLPFGEQNHEKAIKNYIEDSSE